MKINANLIRTGNIIRHEEKMYQVLETSTIKPGKGGAYIQVEMRDIVSGLKNHERWRTSESVEKLNSEEIPVTFLFSDENSIMVMRDDDYEQIEIDKSLINEKFSLLSDGMKLLIEFVDEKIVGLKLPKNLEVIIQEADAVIKGQTSSSSYKPALTTKGVKILVPPHIKQGDKIVIQSENLEYVEKSKN